MPNFFIDVKETGAKKAGKNIGVLAGSIGKLAGTVAIGAVAMETMRKAITRSAEIEGVKRGFDNLARSTGFSTQAFDKFKKATDGTIDNLTLMKKANNAMLLGITDSEDQMANMFDVAQRLGQSLGIDTVQSIDSLVTGLGRQSKLMLDNLGIMVDGQQANKDYADSLGISTSKLTDQQRKTAFVNASMKEANRLVELLGEEQLTTKDSIAQMTTALLQMTTSIGELVSPAITKIASGIKGVAEAFDFVINSVTGADHTFTESGGVLSGYTAKWKKLKDSPGELKDELENLRIQTKKLNEEQENLTNQTKLSIDHSAGYTIMWKDTGESMEEVDNITLHTTDVMTELGRAIVAGEIGLENFIEKQQEHIILQTEDNTAKADGIKFELDLIEAKKLLISKLLEQDKVTQKIGAAELSAVSRLSAGLSKLNEESKGSAKVTARLQQLSIIASTASGMMAAISPPTGKPNLKGWLNFAAVGAAGAAQMTSVSRALGDFDALAQGGDFVTSGPKMIMGGDNPGGQEHVQVTPLSSPNTSGPQSNPINISITGNVLSSDYVEGELADQIRDAIRRGTNFGIG